MRDLEDVWRQVEPRLRRIAAARGVPPGDRDDLVQEVAARVLTSRVAFESADDLLPWAATVLRRIHVDSHRRGERVELSPTPLTIAAHGRRARAGDVADTADIAMARLDLATITETVATWSPDARRILFDGDGDSNGNGRQAGASYVRRHRLRARLLELIDGLSAWVAGRRYDTVYGELGAPIATHAPVAAAACLTAMLAVAGGFFGHDGPSAGDAGRAQPSRPTDFAAADAMRSANGTRGDDTAGDVLRAVPAAVTTKAPQPAPGGDGRAGASGSRLRSPVEHRAEVEAAGQRPSVYVENNEEPRPLSCFGGGEVPHTCIDSPVKLGEDVTLPPI